MLLCVRARSTDRMLQFSSSSNHFMDVRKLVGNDDLFV